MDRMQPEISPPETPAENFPPPAILWKGDHSMLDAMCGRYRLQIGPIGWPGGMAHAANAARPSPTVVEC